MFQYVPVPIHQIPHSTHWQINLVSEELVVATWNDTHSPKSMIFTTPSPSIKILLSLEEYKLDLENKLAPGGSLALNRGG